MVRQNKKTKRPRRRIIRRTQHRLSQYPPRIDFKTIYFNHTIRFCDMVEIQSNSIWIQDFELKSLFGSSYSGLATVFSEVKILKVTIWAMPEVSPVLQGSAVMNVAPSQMNEITHKSKMHTIASAPGSIIRRCTRALNAYYVPTEPTEKDWFKTDDPRIIAKVAILHDLVDSTQNPKITYDIVVDVHIKMRGMHYSKFNEPLFSSSNQDDFHIINSLDEMKCN